jgi:hypothetical protein
MNETLILKTILEQNIIAFEDMEIMGVYYGFKCIDQDNNKCDGQQYVIVQSIETSKLYKFYIKYDAKGNAHLSGDDDIKEVEKKEITIVYYEEVIK